MQSVASTPGFNDYKANKIMHDGKRRDIELSRMDTGRNDDWVIRFWSAHTQVSRKYDMIHDALIRWRGLYNNF